MVRPDRINYLARHTVTLKGEFHTHISLSWFKHHPLENVYGISIWECDLFEMAGVHSVQFIHSRTVTRLGEHDPTVLFVVPCVDF